MPFDANKLYCSEVLAILLQDNDGKAPSQYWHSVRIGARLVSDHDSKLSCLWHPLALPLALCAAFVLCQAVLILFADVVVFMSEIMWFLRSILNNQINILIFLFSSGDSLSEFEHMSIFQLLLQLLLRVYFILEILHWLDNCMSKFSYSKLDLPIFDINRNTFTYFYFFKSTQFQT